MLHVSMHGADNASNASNRPKTSIDANVAVAQSYAPMFVSYAKVLGNGVLRRAMLSGYYGGSAHGYRMLGCLGREFVIEEKVALVGVLVRRMPVPHATGDTCETLEMTTITCLLSASVTRLKSSRRSRDAPEAPSQDTSHTRTQNHQPHFVLRRQVLLQYRILDPIKLSRHRRSRP